MHLAVDDRTKRIEPMMRSAVTLIRNWGTVGAPPIMAHPYRSP